MTTKSSTLRDFLASFDIVDVVNRLTDVVETSQGGRICCPYHAEDTPSCHLYRSDNHFHCYGCGAHGSLLDLVAKLRSVSIDEAIDWLAEVGAVPRPTRSKAAAARSAAHRLLRERLIGAAIAESSDRSADLVRSLGLGKAIGLASMVADLPAKILTDREQLAWEGALTIELFGPGGSIGIGALVPAGSPQELVQAASVEGIGIGGLARARAAIADGRPLLVTMDPSTFLRWQTAGVANVVIVPRRRSQDLARALRSITDRLALIVDVETARRGAALPTLLGFHEAEARTFVVIDDGSSLSPPVALWAYVRAIAEAGRRDAVVAFITATPSPSSRSLYAAEFARFGLITTKTQEGAGAHR